MAREFIDFPFSPSYPFAMRGYLLGGTGNLGNHGGTGFFTAGLGPITWPDQEVESKAISALWIALANDTQNAGNVLRVTVEGISTSSGAPRPDGIEAQFGTLTRPETQEANKMIRVAMSAGPAVSRGQRIAFKVRNSVYVSGNISTPSPTGLGFIGNSKRSRGSMRTENSGATWTDFAHGLFLAIEFEDGTFGTIESFSMGRPYTVNTTWSAADTGAGGIDTGLERGNEFVLAETVRISAISLRVGHTGSDVVRLRLYDSTDTILGEYTRDQPNELPATITTSNRPMSIEFPDGLVLEAGETYRITSEPLVGSAIITPFHCPAAAVSSQLMDGGSVAGVSRTGGAWGVADPTVFIPFDIEVSGIAYEAGAEELPARSYADGINWDDVLAGFLAELAAAPELTAIYGDEIRLAGSAEHVVPLLEATMIADGESELWAPITVQVDLWNKSLTDVRAAENYIRGRYHSQVPIPIGGIPCWAQYSDGTLLAEPGRDGYFGRALRFRFTPLRAAYQGEVNDGS